MIDANAINWQEHPTISGVQTRIIESAASTQGQCDVLMGRVDPQGSIPWHVHQGAQETALVIEGEGVLLYSPTPSLESQRKLDLRPGHVVTIPAGYWHSVLNMGAGPLLLYAFHAPATF
jgi:mannose-6-phosphate isomerase-like protein (cupin superfamily)